MDALHRWVEFRLNAPGTAGRLPALTGPGWAGSRTTLALRDLEAAGVTPTPAQTAHVARSGGTLPVGDVTLTPAQRYRLLRGFQDRQADVTAIAATIAAGDLDIDLTVIDHNGHEQHHPHTSQNQAAVRPAPAAGWHGHSPWPGTWSTAVPSTPLGRGG
ncbi:hypothetical protein [Streptomyces anthocyanicus]|uniref:hypothetical protein n=1 Tax=Streptomyces anthocyanicus TaxID=68174 RepID=UPI002E31E2EB|nr:hypothetical protein [Streptomyces anthocyanicus]